MESPTFRQDHGWGWEGEGESKLARGYRTGARYAGKTISGQAADNKQQTWKLVFIGVQPWHQAEILASATTFWQKKYPVWSKFNESQSDFAMLHQTFSPVRQNGRNGGGGAKDAAPHQSPREDQLSSLVLPNELSECNWTSRFDITTVANAVCSCSSQVKLRQKRTNLLCVWVCCVFQASKWSKRYEYGRGWKSPAACVQSRQLTPSPTRDSTFISTP